MLSRLACSLIPRRMWQANAAMSAAFALLIDELYRGRTAYAEGFRPAGVLDTGRKLYEMYRDLADRGAPGPVYDLVDAWAAELRMRDWCVWRADDSARPAQSHSAAAAPLRSRFRVALSSAQAHAV